MISVREAQNIIDQFATPLSPVDMPLLDATGLTLSRDVRATCDIPAYAQSSMDGYAFAFSDKDSALQIVGEMPAGVSTPSVIGRNQAARIFTGAPLPEGADTVVMQEKSIVNDGRLTINDPEIRLGNSVRPRGSEIKRGELAIAQHSNLTSAALGFLASLGVTSVPVYPAPSVTVILTGNELQQPGSALEFGKVYDANAVMFSSVLKNCGINAVTLLYAADNIQILIDRISEALVNSDLVLLTGGVSVGDYDFVTQAAEYCGIETRFHRVKQRPGKPLYFGTKEKKMVFGLPGNPSSALTCFYIYVLPALGKMQQKTLACKRISAPLQTAFEKPKGLTQFAKAFLNENGVTILPAQESFRLSSYAMANCLAELPEGQEKLIVGETIFVHLLPS